MSVNVVNKATGELTKVAGNPLDDAVSITYDHTVTAMSATNVQAAIDELSAEKKDDYITITYQQWQQLTPTQQAEKDYYISDYPSSQIIAGNVGYSNSTSGMSATNVQSAVDELSSVKQPKTDNSLTTTNKTTTGAINELKNGLTNDSFNTTANECFQIVMQSSHYITSKVVHICAKVKVLTIPDQSVVAIAGLPGGKAIINKGSTIPIYMASGEWVPLSTIVYGYVSDYGIVTNKSDLVVGNYYYVDFIAKIS